MKKCHNCGGAGWTVIATGANGETPEQCQCEWCGGTGEGRELLERDETYTGDIACTNEEEDAWHTREDSDQSSRSGLAHTHFRSPSA